MKSKWKGTSSHDKEVRNGRFTYRAPLESIAHIWVIVAAFSSDCEKLQLVVKIVATIPEYLH